MSPRPPVAKQAGDAARRFCVLTLDGGGARGYLTLKLLEHAESCLDTSTGTRVSLGERFDLVCGTSTGGIIALALALGHPVREVSALYETHLPRIFGPAMRRMSWVDVFRPRYRADALREAMQAFFGDLTLADVRTAEIEVRLPSFWHPARYKGHPMPQPNLVDVCLADGERARLPVTLGASDAQVVTRFVQQLL